jgi:hypothetical protein
MGREVLTEFNVAGASVIQFVITLKYGRFCAEQSVSLSAPACGSLVISPKKMTPGTNG